MMQRDEFPNKDEVQKNPNMKTKCWKGIVTKGGPK
jgi:hypothetical protein